VIGRLRGTEPAEPAELRGLAPGVTEWVVHPGFPDPDSGSEYDLARKEDLATLTRCMVRARFDEPVWGDAVRLNHTAAFAPDVLEALEEA
jgi:hypothetical protein